MKNSMLLRRVQCLFLTLFLILPLFIMTPVNATGVSEIIFGEVVTKAGEEVLVPVTIKNNTGFATFRFRVSYNTDILEFISVEKGSVLCDGTMSSITDSEKQTLTFTWLSVNNSYSDGEIAFLKFKVSDGANGDYPLLITHLPEDLLSENYDQIPYIVTCGKISVQCTMTGIEIVNKPSKLTYLEGDSFNPAGLTVKALYDNGDSENVTDYTVTGYDSTPGSKIITVAYNGFKATFNVQVQAKSLTEIVITSAPVKTEYIEGQIFDNAGLVVIANYNNGTSEVISNYSLSGFKNTVGTHTVTVTFGGKTATFDVKVIARIVTALKVTKMPNKVEYLEGDEITPAGLEVVATYNDGTTEKVTDYICNGYDSTPGEKTIAVMYSGCTTSFTVNVRAKSFTHITITYPEKLTYFVGEEIDTTGLTVTAFYDNGTSEAIESGKYLVEGFDSSAVGTKEITVSYNGKTQSFSVTIVEAPKTFTYGDVTGDGKINLTDVSLLLKKIAKWDVTLDSDAADVTSDGKINLADVSLLLKYIAKWDVVLGK